MKKILALLLLATSTCFGVDTYTTRAGIVKPEEGSSNWGPKIRANYDIIDSSFALLSGTQTFTGTSTFLIFTSTSGIFDRIRVGTSTYVTASDEAAINGELRVGGSNGVVYACDASFQNCSSIA